jgi:hypothetical protein
MRRALHDLVPSLRGSGYQVTSPVTHQYNCIAWAAEDTEHWWWPFGVPGFAWWPEGVPRVATEEAFVAAFGLLGYEICPDPDLESGFTKVAIYLNPDASVSHMARLLPSGSWTSKCGPREDIVHHRSEDLASCYGAVSRILRRPGGDREPDDVQRFFRTTALRVGT